MKTKLELYQAVQTLAITTLDQKAPQAEKAIDGLLNPLKLAPDDRNRFGQLFHSRRGAMLELKDQPLVKAD